MRIAVLFYLILSTRDLDIRRVSISGHFLNPILPVELDPGPKPHLWVG